nr:hypothetical protein [Tanacetum cinerariifolium]
SIGVHDDEAGSSSSRPKRARITENVEEALMWHGLHEFLLWGNRNMTLKNRLCGKAYAMSILDFSKRLVQSIGVHDDEAGSSSSRPKRARITENVEEALMWHGLHEFLLWGNRNMTLKNRTLDANILRELIDSNRRLIPEEIAPSIPRVATPKAPRPTTSDLYDKISQLVTQLGEIKRMTHRQSYHSGIYPGILGHIASHYGFTLHDPYNPPNYFK